MPELVWYNIEWPFLAAKAVRVVGVEARGVEPLTDQVVSLAVALSGPHGMSVPPARLERASFSLAGRCSIWLSYGGTGKGTGGVSGATRCPASFLLLASLSALLDVRRFASNLYPREWR